MPEDSNDEESVEMVLSGELTFSSKQIDYLRSEFDRQRRWVKTLSEREIAVVAELEGMRNSISYRLGRTLTWPLRKIEKAMKNNKISHFLAEEDLDEFEQEVFSSFLISPELLPEESTHGTPDTFIQEVLLDLRTANQSANNIRDLLTDLSYGIGDEVLLDCLRRVTRYVIKSGEHRPTINNLYVAAARCLLLRNPIKAKEYYNEFSQLIKDVRADRTMIQIHMKMGNIIEPLALLKRMNRDNWSADMEQQLEPQAKLIKRGFSGDAYLKKKWASKENTIIYYGAQSLPHTSSGYATRTHGLVRALQSFGHNMEVCLRHGYPLDRSDFKGVYLTNRESIDGLKYRFNPSNNSNGTPEISYSDVFNFSKFEDYEYLCIKTLDDQAKEIRPSIIHAASNFVVGMAAVGTAKALGIPSIYEVRGFWHITQASKRPGYEESDHYNLSESMELQVASMADHVFTITQGIANILIDYGINSNKITILPNAVDIKKFQPTLRNTDLEDDLELYGKVVLGYIGSFVEYEGLDLLLQAVASIKEEIGDSLRVLLVGDGPIYNELMKMSIFLGINDIVTFTGRVSHDEVQDYYSLIDITAFPRKGRRVCELVSPLKPFEAMAMEKAVIASNVEALAEIVDDGVTGLLHEKDDSEALAGCIKKLILDDKLRLKLAKAGRKWVAEHRSWEAVANRVSEVYSKLENK